MLRGCGALDFISLLSNPVIRMFYFWRLGLSREIIVTQCFSCDMFDEMFYAKNFICCCCCCCYYFLSLVLYTWCKSRELRYIYIYIIYTYYIYYILYIFYIYIYIYYTYIYITNLKILLKSRLKNFKKSHTTVNRKLIKQYQ